MIADGRELHLLFVIIAVRTMLFIRGVSWDRRRVLTAAKWNEDIKDTSTAWERIPRKINVSPKGYLLLNNKHDLRKMKANECEYRQKLIKVTLLNGINERSKEICGIKMWILQKNELSPLQWRILSSLPLQILSHLQRLPQAHFFQEAFPGNSNSL